MNTSTIRIIRYALIGIIVLILGALAGWYFYLHMSASRSATLIAEEGGASSTPSFGTPEQGSTAVDQSAYGFSASSTNTVQGIVTSHMWEVDKTPVAGMGFVSGQSPELRYVERANGYVFTGNPASHVVVRLTSVLRPKVYQALVNGQGNVIERSIGSDGSIETFFGTVGSSSASSVGTSSDQSLIGADGVDDVRMIALHPSTNAVFYLLDDPSGGARGISATWNSMKTTQTFHSIIAGWIPMYLADNQIVLLQKPADGILGYAYTLASSGALVPLVPGMPGLTIAPRPDGTGVLYGSSSGSGLSLYTLAGKTTHQVPLATVADKCVWLPGQSMLAYCAVPESAPKGNFLDGWYQGSIHTSDEWWRIDATTGSTTRIYSPSTDNISVDVQHPTIDPSGTYIAFLNGADQSLWILNVAQ